MVRSDFQLRLARVAGANHLAVSFVDPALEKARAAAQAATPAPVNKAALEYITERNSKRDRLPDIPFHRLWRAGGRRRTHVRGFASHRSAKPLDCKQWDGTPGLANYTGATTPTWRSTNAASRSQFRLP